MVCTGLRWSAWCCGLLSGQPDSANGADRQQQEHAGDYNTHGHSLHCLCAGITVSNIIPDTLPQMCKGALKTSLHNTVDVFYAVLQGITVKPLVKVLQITSASKEDKNSLGTTITNHVSHHAVSSKTTYLCNAIISCDIVSC